MTRIEKLIQEIKPNIQEVTAGDVPALIAAGDLVIIDVREASEWEKGHAEGAIHICKGLLECQIEKVISDENTSILLYCGGGVRSAIAAECIQRMGYTNVKSLIGGFKAWATAGLPIEV